MSQGKQIITYPVKYTVDEHATVKRRADAAGLSLQKYIKAMTIDGKVNGHKPKPAKR